MPYSQDALTFSTIPTNHQVRLEDRVSYLYLEYCLIRQDRTGVIAIREGEGRDRNGPKTAKLQVPVAGMAVLLLGPGTSLSHAAAVSCARSGVVIMFCGGGGISCYTHASPLTSSAKWAIAQARLVASEGHQIQAALYLYKLRLGVENMPGGTINAMRGLEGRTIRNVYKAQAKKYGIKGFRRDSNGDDVVNVSLNLANSILYGCAGAACSAIGVNPALGIIHRGNVRSLLFDLADLYKPTMTIPLAFSATTAEDPLIFVRRKIRAAIFEKHVVVRMLDALMQVLSPHLPRRDDDRLLGSVGEEVSGHIQYGKDS